jgi:hypothetical protein
MSLPWIPGAARVILLADPVFAGLVPQAERVGFESPLDVTSPFVVIQAPGNFSLSGDGVAWSPLVQVDGYAPKSYPDARRLVWRIAAEAGRVLGRARNVTFENMSYSGRVTDGPLEDVDTSRGTASPLRRCLIRAELKAHTT